MYIDASCICFTLGDGAKGRVQNVFWFSTKRSILRKNSFRQSLALRWPMKGSRRVQIRGGLLNLKHLFFLFYSSVCMQASPLWPLSIENQVFDAIVAVVQVGAFPKEMRHVYVIGLDNWNFMVLAAPTSRSQCRMKIFGRFYTAFIFTFISTFIHGCFSLL